MFRTSIKRFALASLMLAGSSLPVLAHAAEDQGNAPVEAEADADAARSGIVVTGQREKVTPQDRKSVV